MKKVIVHKSVAPFYIAAAVWVLYALLFPLYAVKHFILAAAASAVAFLVAKAFCKDVTEEIEVELEPVKTGNEELDQMLADGLAEEVSRLLKNGVPRDAKAMKAIGYKEMIPYALGETTLDEAVYALKLNTRHYAKRQLTWMRREEDVLWVDALEPDAYDKLEAYYTQGEAK